MYDATRDWIHKGANWMNVLEKNKFQNLLSR